MGAVKLGAVKLGAVKLGAVSCPAFPFEIYDIADRGRFNFCPGRFNFSPGRFNFCPGRFNFWPGRFNFTDFPPSPGEGIKGRGFALITKGDYDRRNAKEECESKAKYQTPLTRRQVGGFLIRSAETLKKSSPKHFSRTSPILI